MAEQIVLDVPIEEVLLIQQNLEFADAITIIRYEAYKPARLWYCQVTVSYEDALWLYRLGRYVGIDGGRA